MRTISHLNLAAAAALALFASAALLPATARAGGHDNWATAGKILTGVVGYQVLSGLAHDYRDRDRVYYCEPTYYYRDTRTVYVTQPPTVVYREPQVIYYTQPEPVSVYRPASPQVVYVQQPAPTQVVVQQPAPQQVVVQQPQPAPQVQQPAPQVQQPAPQPQQPAPQAQQPAQPQPQQPAPQVQQPAPQAPTQAMPSTGDVDPNQYVVVALEEGKRLIQPRQRGHAATMQMWSDVKKEWIDIKAYPSIW